MSVNSSAFLAIASASSPEPITAVASGGVARRHAQRAIPRKTNAASAARRNIRAAPAVVSEAAGVRGKSRATAAVPPAAQARMPGTSSTVRWRIASWSRS